MLWETLAAGAGATSATDFILRVVLGAAARIVRDANTRGGRGCPIVVALSVPSP